MDKQELFEKVRAVISDAADIEPEEIELHSLLMDDLELSSLEVLTIIAELEETLSVSVPENELMKILSVEDMVTLLGQYIGQ